MLPTPTKKRGFRVERDPRPPQTTPPPLQGLTLRNSLPYCRSEASSCVSGWVVTASYATPCVMGKGTPLPEGHPPKKNQGYPNIPPCARTPAAVAGRHAATRPGSAAVPPPSPGPPPDDAGPLPPAGMWWGGVQNSGGAPPNFPPPSPIDLFLSFFTLFCLFAFCCWTWAAKRPSCGTPGSFLTAAFARFPWGGHTVWGGWHPQTRPVPPPSPGLWRGGGR